MNYGKLELILKKSNTENDSLRNEVKLLKEDYNMIKINFACIPGIYYSFKYFESLPIFGAPGCAPYMTIASSLVFSFLLFKNYKNYKNIEKKLSF